LYSIAAIAGKFSGIALKPFYMEQGLFIAIFAGLVGMFGWGLADFFAKKTINEVGDVVTLAWAHVFGTVILFFAFFFQLISQGISDVPSDFQTWILLLFFGILQAAVYLLVYSGFKKGQVAVLSPIFASFSGFTAVISIAIIGEIVNRYIFVGLAFIFIGIILINLDIQAVLSRRLSFIRVPGFREIACATVLAVVWTLLWDKFVEGRDWLVYTMAMYAFMTLAILVVAKLQRLNLFIVKTPIWKFLVIIGICEIVAYLAISWGYSASPMTSVVALLSGAFSLPTIFLAHIFLKEKVMALQVGGGLIIILGIMILSVL
jgi:drug/metabolite transporter (DMT)-like permease